jgi:S-adenosyl-L-methionine hydrolase (adenosine-forming)
MQHRSIITLTTDFGTRDPFAGIIKGVIAGINPDAAVIDLTHAVAPQNVREGAFILSISKPYFPKGTVHVTVVDPGVGGQRRAIAADIGDCFFVGPDNGVLSWVLGDAKRAVIRQIANPEYIRHPVSATFHGRDIFAPAAAYLSAGVPIGDLGPAVDDPVMFPFPRARERDREIRGEILYIDRFGNLITNIRPEDPDGVREISIGDKTIGGLSENYGQGGGREVIALVGSTDFIEIAVNLGSAADEIGASVGDEVRVLL